MKVIFLVIIGFLTAFLINSAFAHKVIIFAWVEDGMIYSESQFASKRKAKGCPIIVTNDRGDIVHEGKTDDQGEYAFKIPEGTDSDLTLTLKAGEGHQGRWKIPRQELLTNVQPDSGSKPETKKEPLPANEPSMFRIVAGIGIIALLALGLTIIKKKPSVK